MSRIDIVRSIELEESIDLLTKHSVLTGCVIIFEMTVTPSLFIKSSIYTCRTDNVSNDKSSPPK